ncbi:conserved hypothetical protein [Paecilomyces variotii No. 5]|uniref:Xylanolytic transcriptional activator regulatory domain-containing protein n=1 Tax=Byssochlamys spectabilis (strain No. 5 / NBRC 109023) TaxID=1356009 RepID=V5FTT9_BYSSN|nr:conserved hypothetical protein [Paecilomyces variotii No. 5]
MGKRLAGKVAVVTGGASGFGQGIAAKFVGEGAQVLIADLSEDNGKKVAQELGCKSIVADVSKREHWQELLQKVLNDFGSLDIVVNNAGITYANKPTLSVTDADFDKVMNVNVKSIYLSTDVVVPYFLNNNRPGVFIHISSTAAIRPRPGLTWYNASKGAVSIASKSMAVEWGPSQIRSNTVCPVVGSTGMTHLFLGKPDTEANRSAFVETIPLRRPSTPADVANACCYLASDEAAFITGIDLESNCEYENSFIAPNCISPDSTGSSDGALDSFNDTTEHTISPRVALSVDQEPITAGQGRGLFSDDVHIRGIHEHFEGSNTSLSDNDNSTDFYADPMPFPEIPAQSGISGSLFHAPSQELPMSMSLGYSGLDWLDFQLQDPVIPDETSTGLDFSDPSFMQVPTPRSRLNDDRNSELRTQGMPSSDNLNALTMINGFAQSATQQWPFDQNGEKFPRRYRLPPLRDILQRTSMPTMGENADMLEEVANLLSGPYVPAMNDSTYDYTKLSALHFLQQTMDRFFVEFHPILPLVHIPTSGLFTCPTVLITAMACIGAMLMQDSESPEKTMAFSDLCTRMLFWQGWSDSNSYSDLSYLSACCLHQIFSLGSGNRQLYQDADRSRGSLIGGLRGMGLLRSRVSIEAEKGDFQPSTSTEPNEVHTEWIEWKDRERGKRVAWAAFEYDCSLATLTGRRGAVDLGELPYRLPCAEALWEAPSAQAWKTLSTHSCFGIPVADVLRRATSGKSVQNEISSWGKRLCSQVIGRLLWDIKQLELTSFSEALRLPSLIFVQQQAKSSLLQAFGGLSRSIKKPGTNKELIDYNIAQLIIHYCNLYSSEDVMDLVVYIVRNVAARDASADLQLIENAKQRLKTKLACDPCRSRRLIWHAAQILAIANQYLVSAPCEILRIFMGSIFLMAFAKYSGSPVDYDGGNEPNLPSIKLDEIDDMGGRESQLVTNWIQHGGPACITGVEDIYSEEFASHVSAQTQSLLQRIQYWGLSRKFVKILQIFQDAG